MKKGIIFDLDGTLWDTVNLAVKGWNEVLGKYDFCKLLTRSLMESYMGKTLEQIAELHMPDLDYDTRMKIAKECDKNSYKVLNSSCGEIYPKVEETLNSMKDEYSFYCVSNSENGYVQIFMEVSHLGYLFDDFEMAGRTGKCKGENIKMVAERNNLDMACYVGDTVMDKEASVIANVPFIYAKYGFGDTDSEFVLQQFSDLPKVAEEIFQ